MKYTLLLIIFNFVFLVSCSNPTIEVNELSTQKGPFEVVENQDSIKVYHQEKLFTGTAIQYFNKSQIFLKAEYLKGLLHGKLLKYNNIGNVIIELNSIGGFNDGLVKTFYDNGNLKETSFFSNGKRNGTFQAYFKNGGLNSSRFYDKNGNGNGIFKRYDSIGNLVGTISVKEDKYNWLLESFKYDEKNNVVESQFSNYKNSILEGKSYILNKEKDTMFSANYINGLVEGIAKNVINKKGDYTLTKYLKGNRNGTSILYDRSGVKKIIIQKKKKVKDVSISHICNYCKKSFVGKGYYMAGTSDGLVINQSNNESYELCCSVKCAKGIMGF
jgi:antitoxin component YwqK of YwqJK toxin-antitoxin module